MMYSYNNYLCNSSVTDSIISSERAFLVAGLERVIVSTPSSLVTFVKDAMLLLCGNVLLPFIIHLLPADWTNTNST